MPNKYGFRMICTVKKYYLFFLVAFFTSCLEAQNEYSKWYFGYHNGLDFMTNPPSLIAISALNSNFGTANESDDNGNLQFYTDGLTVYDQTHAAMANGTGLLGTNWPTQGCLTVRKPGSVQLYYIFTVVGNGLPGGLNYSIVDMNLAAGMGSVTVKNATVYPGGCDGKITGTRHCNGKDLWIVIKEVNSNVFRSYLLTSAGLNTTAVISSGGPSNSDWGPCMKISPSGNKLAELIRPPIPPYAWYSMVLYDFDSSLGIVSNPTILNDSLRPWIRGLEFSPNGSKVYCVDNNVGSQNYLHQWDLCAGSLSAIMASHSTLQAVPSSFMQLAINGKIYICPNVLSLDVINDPDQPGTACNFILAGQPITNGSGRSLPNFINKYKRTIPAFSATLAPTLGCHAFTFTANLPFVSCAASNYSVASLVWDFGDPATGALNNSAAAMPVHYFSNSGSYTVSLVFNYKCGSDTIRQVVTVPPPFISALVFPGCNNTASATVNASGGIGPYTYSWLPSSQTGSVAVNLGAGSHTVIISDLGSSCTISTVIAVTTKSPPVIILIPADSLSFCEGSNAQVQVNGTATSYSCFPSDGLTINNNTIQVSASSSKTYTITGSLNSCTNSVNLKVRILPLPKPSVSGQNKVACISGVLKLSGSGGIKYEWLSPSGELNTGQSFTCIIKGPRDAGAYTLTVTDAFGCKNFTTALVSLGPAPDGILNGLKTEGCVPLSSDFSFSAVPQSVSVLSTWEIGQKKFSTSSFSYCFKQAGTYTIQGTLVDTASECTNRLSYFVNVHDKPHADYYYLPENPVENFDDVKFVSSSTGENLTDWLWFFNGDASAPLITKSSAESLVNNFPDAGIYAGVLIVSNKWQCSDTIIKPVRIEEDFNVFVPDVFSPNHDGLNDEFIPVVRGAALYQLEVLNRWGEMVFKTIEPGKGWNGLYHEEPAKEDVYVWRINAKSNKGQVLVKEGHVLLDR
jgi:gliding motility-associated-like protein